MFAERIAPVPVLRINVLPEAVKTLEGGRLLSSRLSPPQTELLTLTEQPFTEQLNTFPAANYTQTVQTMASRCETKEPLGFFNKPTWLSPPRWRKLLIYGTFWETWVLWLTYRRPWSFLTTVSCCVFLWRRWQLFIQSWINAGGGGTQSYSLQKLIWRGVRALSEVMSSPWIEVHYLDETAAETDEEGPPPVSLSILSSFKSSSHFKVHNKTQTDKNLFRFCFKSQHFWPKQMVRFQGFLWIRSKTLFNRVEVKEGTLKRDVSFCSNIKRMDEDTRLLVVRFHPSLNHFSLRAWLSFPPHPRLRLLWSVPASHCVSCSVRLQEGHRRQTRSGKVGRQVFPSNRIPEQVWAGSSRRDRVRERKPGASS